MSYEELAKHIESCDRIRSDECEQIEELLGMYRHTLEDGYLNDTDSALTLVPDGWRININNHGNIWNAEIFFTNVATLRSGHSTMPSRAIIAALIRSKGECNG